VSQRTSELLVTRAADCRCSANYRRCPWNHQIQHVRKPKHRRAATPTLMEWTHCIRFHVKFQLDQYTLSPTRRESGQKRRKPRFLPNFQVGGSCNHSLPDVGHTYRHANYNTLHPQLGQSDKAKNKQEKAV